MGLVLDKMIGSAGDFVRLDIRTEASRRVLGVYLSGQQIIAAIPE